jgi:hypothetical protein
VDGYLRMLNEQKAVFQDEVDGMTGRVEENDERGEGVLRA